MPAAGFLIRRNVLRRERIYVCVNDPNYLLFSTKSRLCAWYFLLTACVSIAAVVLICAYLLGNGIPTIREIGLGNFFGKTWKPSKDLYGIVPMIVGSIYVTAGAIVIGVPIGLLTAIYMARFCPKWLYRVVKPAVDLMAGIPSIVYGFFGLVVIVPMMQSLTGTSGKGLLTASILLGIMILPTIIGVAETSIRAVPESYYEGSLALGATHERSVFFAQLPAAASGVMSGVILGVGRAIGETMAVIMIAGNQPIMPRGVVCDVGGTNDRPSILTFGDIRGLNNESDKQDTSEQLKQQSGEKSGETAFLSATVKIIDGDIQINTSGKVEYSPLITVYSVTGDEASFLPLGNDANTIVKADGSKTSISSSDYTWKYDQKGDATFSISLNPAEYMGISDPIDRVELAAYMRSAKRTIGKNIVLNFD